MLWPFTCRPCPPHGRGDFSPQRLVEEFLLPLRARTGRGSFIRSCLIKQRLPFLHAAHIIFAADAGPVALECALFPGSAWPLEDPVLPSRQAAENPCLHGFRA